jgi:putative oxidoreductase
MSSPVSGPVTGNESGRLGFPGTAPVPTRPPGTNSLWALAAGEGRVEALERYAPLLGRILLSQVFLISGVMKLVDWPGTEAKMAEQGMFWIPFFHVAALLVELVAGLALLVGFKARLGALVLFLYLIPVTFTFHHFWSYPPDKQEVQTLFFLHNWALMGGLLFVTACGAGAFSLDRWLRRAR